MTSDATTTRGERNNNPGNINYDPANVWRGQLGLELVPEGEGYAPRFARFGAPVYGIRALAKLLATYIRHDHCTTLEAIIDRWAPAADRNDTASYINDVCQRTGYGADHPLAADAATLGTLVRALIHHENGRCLYDPALIAQAVQMALGAA